MLAINNCDGRNIAEFYLQYPFEDFLSQLNNIKNTTNLSLVKTEENEVMMNGHLIVSYAVFYADQSEQIEIRISERSFAIDFNHFITYNDTINEKEFIKMRDREVDQIRIILTATNNETAYHVFIENVKRYFLIEDISRLSKHDKKKIADCKGRLKYTEICL